MGALAPGTGALAPGTGALAPGTSALAPGTGALAPGTGALAPVTYAFHRSCPRTAPVPGRGPVSGPGLWPGPRPCPDWPQGACARSRAEQPEARELKPTKAPKCRPGTRSRGPRTPWVRPREGRMDLGREGVPWPAAPPGAPARGRAGGGPGGAGLRAFPAAPGPAGRARAGPHRVPGVPAVPGSHGGRVAGAPWLLRRGPGPNPLGAQ